MTRYIGMERHSSFTDRFGAKRMIYDKLQIVSVEELKKGRMYVEVVVSESGTSQLRELEFLALNPPLNKTFRAKIANGSEVEVNLDEFGIIPTKGNLWRKGKYLIPRQKQS